MDAPYPLADLGPRTAAAAEALRRVVAGRVSTSPLARWMYSTDASSYRVVPDVVLVAAETGDLIAAASVAAEYELPLVMRGAGTSVAGQAIGPGIMVDCFKLDRIIDIDPDGLTARVEPGVIQAQLNRAAATYGLEFGPDPSTIDQATIGGMVANNSSGSRSIVYGESRDKVSRIAGVLVGGDGLVFGPSRGAPFVNGLRAIDSGPRAQALAVALESVRDQYAGAIAQAAPGVRRNTSGYNLRELLEPAPNLARLLAGSEGTLALFLELEVMLDRRPELRLGAAIAFRDVRHALVANVAILETRPSAVELLDLVALRTAPHLDAPASLTPIMAGESEAMLIVEYQGSIEETQAGLRRLRGVTPELGTGQVVWLETAGALAGAFALRRAVLPLLMGTPGVERPAAFIEDTAVAPECLADFVEDLRHLLDARGLRASFSGHASAGCLHVRPWLNLKTSEGLQHLEAVAQEVAGLVAHYRGVISGEHGCGRARSALLPGVLGEDVMAAMVAVKDAFDPARLLAPGVIVDGRPVGESLRYGSRHADSRGWTPRLSHTGQGGFELAVERCFGAGLCKKTTGGMCPTAAVNREETLSTRARANVLQGILCGAIPLASLDDEELRAVVGTCLACKACKTECPAGVDMAALKVEWLAEVRARNGAPPLARVAGQFRRAAAAGSLAGPLVATAVGAGLARRLASRAGLAPQRPLPEFARRSLTRRVGREGATRPVAAPTLTPALFLDCFIQYQEPEVGEAVLELLRFAGLRPYLLNAGCCGRTSLSTGQIDTAREQARHAVPRLYDVLCRGAEVLFVEPSCLSMVRDDWPRLLPEDRRVGALAEAARPALALVADLAGKGRLTFAPGGRVLLHTHCHEKALGFDQATLRALGAVPDLRVEAVECGCCGMSGLFGYEADHYDLSVAVAEHALLPAVRAAGDDTVVLATGTSCRRQIADLAPREALHPLVFLASRLVREPVARDGASSASFSGPTP